MPNLNGIVAKNGTLLEGQSNTGQLFRVDPGTGTANGSIFGVELTSADGLELRGHVLYVIRNADNVVSVVRLKSQLASGAVVGDIDDGLDIPSTASLAAGRLWAVNARFGTEPTPDTDYWICGGRG